MSFKYAGIELEFQGTGVDEIAIVKSCSNPQYKIEIGKEVVSVDPKYFRPTEVDLLLGDPTKAETKLGWKREYKLETLVNDMMKSDLKLMNKDVYLQDGGYKTMSYFKQKEYTMLREIIRPTSENYSIRIPKEYIDIEVEILVLPFDGKKNKIKPKEYTEVQSFSNHSANTIEEWLDDSEDEIWN